MRGGAEKLGSPLSGSLAQPKPWAPRHTEEQAQRRTRRNHASSFKARVALAAIKNDKTLIELTVQFDIHPNQISEWKQQLQESAPDVFGSLLKKKADEPDLKVLHAKIGQLTLKNDFLR